jgi:hypothetical protein
MVYRKLLSVIVLLVFLLAFLPAPVVWAQTPDASILQQLFDRLDKKTKWEYYKSKVDDSLIAWDESYIMRAYLYMYNATKDKKYLEEFIGHADSALRRRDSERGVSDYRGLSLPAWRSGKYTNYQEYRIYAVQTGLVATPLAMFASIVNKDPSLSQYASFAGECLGAAKDAIKVHDMRDKPQYLDIECKWYEQETTMYLDRPLNMNLAQGSAMLAVYEATGDRSYLEKATKIANNFKKYLTIDQAKNNYIWKYYPWDTKYGKVVEDIDHSIYDTEFINLAYRSGIFNDADMQKFANTAGKVMVKNDGTIAKYVDGTGVADYPGWIANWLWFEPWSQNLFNVSYNILSVKSSVNPKELAGLGLLNYSFALKNRTASDTKSPPQVNITAPGGGSVLSGNTVNLEAAASDDTGVSRVTFAWAADQQGPWTNIGEATLSSGSSTTGAWRLSLDISGMQNGAYYLKATAQDAAGNTASSSLVSFEIIRSLLVNGDFTNGTSGWANINNSAKINSSGSNKYLTNNYNFDFYQELNLKPGVYKLKAKTKKGTSTAGARIVVQFRQADGKKTAPYDFTYRNTGSGWESMPEMTIQVPSSAVITRIYLLANPGSSGTQHFDDLFLTAG